MDSTFDRYQIDQRPVDSIGAAQLGLILGLNTLFEKGGDEGRLTLTCARCAANGAPQLDTNNNPEDPVWKIDCQCRRRRAHRQTGIAMPARSDLLLLVEELLGPLGLVVRCPHRPCITKDLTLRQTTDGLTVVCPCGKELIYKKERPTRPN